MKLVQLKCPSCGSELKIRKDSDKAKCEFCGITTIIDDEKIVVEHQIKNNNLDIMYENAFIYLNKLKKYKEAKKIFLKLSKIKPGDSKIWMGLILAETENFNVNMLDEGCNFPDSLFLEEAFENYISTADDDGERKEFEEKYKKYSYIVQKNIDLVIENERNEIAEKDSVNRKIILCVFFIITLLIIVIFLENGEIEEPYEMTTSEKIEEYYSYIDTIDCPYFKDGIMDIEMDENLFITKDKVYEITREGLFSNNYQCREVGALGDNIDLVGELRLFDYRYADTIRLFAITENGYVCSLPDLNCKKNYASSIIEPILEKRAMTNYQVLFRPYENGVSENKALVYLNDSKELYYASEIRNAYYTGDVLLQKIDLNFKEGEKIIHIGKNVTTNKGVYYVKEYISNYEECNKYVDVECVNKYGLFKLKRLSSLYDEIYFVGRYIVSKDGRIYSGESDR